MSQDAPAELASRRETVAAFQVNVTSYRLGDVWHARVDNIDPGAVVARGQGATREEAERQALDRARPLVEQTRLLGGPRVRGL
jgi:hypothetical protein